MSEYDDWTVSTLIPRASSIIQALANAIAGSQVSITIPDANDYTVVLTMRKGGRNIVATLVFTSDPTRPGEYFFSISVTVNGVPVDLQFAQRPWASALNSLNTQLDEIEAALPSFTTRIVNA